jgi:hypothetical protein
MITVGVAPTPLISVGVAPTPLVSVGVAPTPLKGGAQRLTNRRLETHGSD